MKKSTEEKIKTAMKRMSALIEQYYKEHEDAERGPDKCLRHYADYVHGVSYIENNSVITDRITLHTVDKNYHDIDITYRKEGRELFEKMTGGNK